MTFDQAKYKRQWYLDRKEEISAKRREMHRKQNLARDENMRSNRGPKPVSVMYPESTLPDWFTLAEYKRRQSEFASDAVVFINGQRVETQMELI